jgi:hypothetical protein
MATYYIDFENQTDQVWTMGVYQTFPDSPGLDSVVWKQTTAPPDGSTGVSWEITYNSVLANYQQFGGLGVYKSSQTKETVLGKKWKIVMSQNVQQLILDGDFTEGELLISNQSGLLASPGIGMSGTGSAFKQNIVSGSAAQFKVTPTYWAALFNNVVLGEVISGNVIVGPLQVVFPKGMNGATLSADLDGQSIVLNLAYSQRAQTSAAVARALIARQPDRAELMAEFV